MKFLLPNNPLPSIGVPGGIGSNPYMPKELRGMRRAVNYYADYGGCGFWRMIWPEYMINIYQKGVVSGGINMILDPRYYAGVVSARVQRQATPQQFGFLQHLKNISQHNGMKLLYEVDDVIFIEDIPPYNACRHAFDNKEVRETSVQAMLLCDRVTVCSEYMRDYYAKKTNHPNVTFIPNYAPKFWFDRFYSEEKIEERFDRYRRKPRVGVFASATHVDVTNINSLVDDFTHVNKAIIRTCKDIQWVLMGGRPHALTPYIEKGLIEHHPWVNLNDFPAAIDKLNVNITFAPLIDNEFNKAKSDIKIVEAGALGIPCICQDLVTYKDAIVKFTTGDELIEKIVKLMKNEQYYFEVSKKSRAYAEGRWLEDHLDEYLDLYCLK
jgi:glycosyltransferase involved in cell wall biosynthesis